MKKIFLLALIVIVFLYSDEGNSFYNEKRGEFVPDTSTVTQFPIENILKDKNNENNREIDYPKDVYDFPEKEDLRYLTLNQKIEYYQMPTKLLGEISTPALLETCLNYPILNLVKDRSYKSVFKSFNGFNELIKRQDVREILLAVYNKTTYDSYSELDTCHKLTLFSYMLCIEDVMALFSRNEKVCLLEYTLNKPNYPESKELLIAKILLNLEYLPMINLMNQNELIKGFVKGETMRMFPPKLITEMGNKFIAEYRTKGGDK